MMNRLPLFLSAIILAAPSSLLADEPPSDHRPVISPDGNSVVFMSTREGGDWELFSVKLDGTRLKRLTHNIGWDGYAVWAPDGRSFIFDREEDGVRGAYIYECDSATVRPFIVMDDARVAVSGWSSTDDKVIMFIERDGKRDLYLADSDGTHLQQITSTPESNEHDAHFSPDGNMLAYAVSLDGGSALDVMDLATRDVRRYVSSTQNLYGLDWSQDGSRIAFTDTPNDNPEANAELYVLELSSSEVQRLTNNEDYDHMSVWLPNDERIMFSSYSSGREEIYILDLDDMGVRKFQSGLQ